MLSWQKPQTLKLEGYGPQLKLFDSVDKKIRPVVTKSTANMYVCGITPYNATHLGHAVTYLTFDLIHRILMDSGHKVNYVQNVTNIDEPLFNYAKYSNLNWLDLSNREISLFHKDMVSLSVLPPSNYISITESIDSIINLIKKMLQNGSAYALGNANHKDIYYCLNNVSDSKYMFGYDYSSMIEAFIKNGGDPNRNGKVNNLDTILWRSSRPGEPSWPSPFGAGIPCWHIECSAIVLDKFKFGIDIQGGGRDLIFPHHEFSAAYAKTVNIGRKFANHYVHNGLIYYNGYKMSKSRGNIILISQLLNSGLDPAALRLAVLSEHYRKDRSWNNLVIERANARLKLWRHATSLSTELETTNLIKNLRQYLAYDLDTPRVLTLVDTWCIDALNCSGYSSNASRQLINALDVLLGIKLF